MEQIASKMNNVTEDAKKKNLCVIDYIHTFCKTK